MWADMEMAAAKLGDARRNKRAAQLLGALAEHAESSIPQAQGSVAATKAAYRFCALGDSHPDHSAGIMAAHVEATTLRCRLAGEILVAQDTTELNFGGLGATTGLGPISDGKTPGLLVHSALALSADGTPLGLLHQQVWARDFAGGKRKTHKQRPIGEKESQRWLDGLDATIAAVAGTSTTATLICDREGDIYDLFARERPENVHLLVRASWNRRAKVDGKWTRLFSALQARPALGVREVEVERGDGKAGRMAQVEVRAMAVDMQPPKSRSQKLPLVPLWLVHVAEVGAPAELSALEWWLWSSRPATDAASAWALVQRYRLRWRIERWHYTLKSGCRIEKLQLESAARLCVALTLYSIVAWRLLALCYAARDSPDAPATELLDADACEVLVRAVRPRDPPKAGSPPTMRQALRWIAQLGGFLGRKGDGEPGVASLWRGLRRLDDLVSGYRLARQTYG